jgi:hypothetical protein
MRLRGRALALAFGVMVAAACAPLPPPVFTPPPAGPPVEETEPRVDGGGPRVTGRLLTADGRPLITGAIMLSPLDGEPPPGGRLDDVDLTPDGGFGFRNVPPGQYQIRARGQTQPSGPSLYATFTITVSDRDLTDIDMTLAPGSRVIGQLAVNAVRRPKPLGFAGIQVRAPFADGSSFGDTVSGEVGPDGAFVIEGLMAGRHVIVVEGLQPPWILASVSHHGRDITDAGFESRSRQDLEDVRVTITDEASEITGLVLDGTGAGVPDVLVVAVTPAPQFWTPTSRRLGSTRTDSSGRYRLRGLPSGEYRLTASRELDASALQRPAAVKDLASGGVPVTLRGPERREVDLRVADRQAPPAPGR